MKRFITSTLFTLTIILLSQFIDINLFKIDLYPIISSELFKSLRYDPEVDAEVILFDIESIEPDEVKKKLEILESLGPTIIGIDLCHVNDTSEVLDTYLRQNNKIVTCDCNDNADKGTSRITTSKNEVTHFRSDKDSYFELQLSGKPNRLKERGNKKERINFRAVNMYYQFSLSEVENISPELVKDKTILVGSLYDSFVTPMNQWYGRPGVSEGDMSAIQISANIISTINRNEFINEVSPFLRISIILLVSLLCSGLIWVVRTRYTAINIILYLTILIVLNGLSSYIIVYAFSKSYFIELNEMTVILIISAIVSVYWNTKDDNKASAQNIEITSTAEDGVSSESTDGSS